MQNTLLISILQKFSSVERHRWIDYLQSDYHCTNQKLRRLALIIMKQIRDWEQPRLTKQECWSKLFPSKPYQEKSLNNYVSDLLQHTYQFLSHERLKEQTDLQFEMQIKHLLDLNLTKQADRTLRRWKRLSGANKGADALFVRQAQARFEDTIGLMGSRRQHTRALQEQSRHLDHYYALQQLINYCGMLSRQSIIQGDYELPYLKEILRRYDANEQELQAEPAISVYVALVKLLQQNSTEEEFKALEQQLHQHPDALPDSERKMAYNFLLNYCIRQINRGQTHFYASVFNIYQNLLKEGLLLQDGYLTQWTYTNIITTASRLKAWDWTENFIHQYRTQLPQKDQHNAYYYNLSALRYEKGDYKEALQGLNEVEFTDAFYQMAAKTIQLKIYYLLQEADAFRALLFASRQFIVRNRQLSTAKKQTYQNFLKLLGRLFDLRYEQPFWNAVKWQKRFSQLEERLDNPKYSASSKDWIRAELQLLS